MSRHHAQRQGLKEVSGLVNTLTVRMMTAYAVGTRPTEQEVMAFCRGVLLLEEHRVSLPHFAEDVIARLQAQEDVSARSVPVAQSSRPARGSSMLDRMLSPFRLLRFAGTHAATRG